MSRPSMEMVPAVGVSMPPMSPSKVDFPLPDGPTMARNCLAGTSSEMSSRMETSRPPLTSRSEEHTSELQSQSNLVCRLLLEKKKNKELHAAIVAYHSRLRLVRTRD